MKNTCRSRNDTISTVSLKDSLIDFCAEKSLAFQREADVQSGNTVLVLNLSGAAVKSLSSSLPPYKRFSAELTAEVNFISSVLWKATVTYFLTPLIVTAIV